MPYGISYKSAELLLPECHFKLEKAKEAISKVEHIAKDPVTFVYEYFEDLKRDVDLRRENLKAQIDEHSDKTILSLETNQKKCMDLAANITVMTKDIEKSREELNEWGKKLEELKKSTQFLMDTQVLDETVRISREVNEMLEKYKESLLAVGRRSHPTLRDLTQDYVFVSIDWPISKIFGDYGSFFTLFDSKILKDLKQQIELVQLCGFPTDCPWQLEYRGSDDGFEAKQFHKSLDGRPNTLTICKAANGNIFGGFSQLTWDEDERKETRGYYEGDENEDEEEEVEVRSCPQEQNRSFIFSLVNKENMPMKLKHLRRSSICRHSTYGPAFGEFFAYDLFVNLDSKELGGSNQVFSSLGNSYEHPLEYLRLFRSCRREVDGKIGETLLGGSRVFDLVEIEVYRPSFIFYP